MVERRCRAAPTSFRLSAGLWLIRSIWAEAPHVRDMRISVALILESLAAGMSVAEIVDAYPSLTEESVRGVLAELAHQQEPHPA